MNLLKAPPLARLPQQLQGLTLTQRMLAGTLVVVMIMTMVLCSRYASTSDMEPLMRADQPNETAILAQIDKIAQARAELEKANARFLLAIRGKLMDAYDEIKSMQM